MDNPVVNWRQNRVKLTRGENATEFLPTWQAGQEQTPEHDPKKYAEQGYSKNSLIYSCVKEKATSFATLHPAIEKKSGEMVREHRVLDLLRNPNSYQDGQEFAEIAKTMFEVAGNCYIKKSRKASSPERRAEFSTYPIQELHLVRPDYVTILPGATRDRDVFVVTVGGSVMERIPRSDMIHISEPNLINDFYGLPKIALLTREGDIDLQMSDYELSFYRNAGVPMGLLKVKGQRTPEDQQEIKDRFRKAYNGVRKWFDLLVLNSDVAEYQQMGIPQNEMEAEGTRFHVESRICSVFGVPGIIVGARFANTGGQTFNYEMAEHAFWSETMVPDAMRFARAYTKFLLPEFATSGDRGSQITYDFTVVRALQEDRSRKMREVVRMILTGGFTVNQALQSMGLPIQPNGDFYIRNGNQVVVTLDGEVAPMAPNTQGPNPDNPLEGAAQLVREAEAIVRGGA